MGEWLNNAYGISNSYYLTFRGRRHGCRNSTTRHTWWKVQHSRNCHWWPSIGCRTRSWKRGPPPPAPHSRSSLTPPGNSSRVLVTTQIPEPWNNQTQLVTGYLIPDSSHLVYMRVKSRSIIHFPKRFALSTLFLFTSSSKFRFSCLYEDRIFITFPVIFDISWIKNPPNREMTFPLNGPIYPASNCFLWPC